MSVASFGLVIRNRSVVNKNSYEVTKSCVVIIPLYLGIEHSAPYDFVIDTCYQHTHTHIYIHTHTIARQGKLELVHKDLLPMK